MSRIYDYRFGAVCSLIATALSFYNGHVFGMMFGAFFSGVSVALLLTENAA